MTDKDQAPMQDSPDQSSSKVPAPSNASANCDENSCNLQAKKTVPEVKPAAEVQEVPEAEKSDKKDSPKKDSDDSNEDAEMKAKPDGKNLH